MHKEPSSSVYSKHFHKICCHRGPRVLCVQIVQLVENTLDEVLYISKNLRYVYLSNITCFCCCPITPSPTHGQEKITDEELIYARHVKKMKSHTRGTNINSLQCLPIPCSIHLSYITCFAIPSQRQRQEKKVERRNESKKRPGTHQHTCIQTDTDKTER